MFRPCYITFGIKKFENIKWERNDAWIIDIGFFLKVKCKLGGTYLV
jgi:hypothetical protein